MRLANKVALITGGTGGMGSASARLVAREVAAVVIAARHEEASVALIKDITTPAAARSSCGWTRRIKRLG